MDLLTVLVLASVAVLAYANGTNDVSKGIATLAGSGVTDYRRAILWGTVWTMAGAGLAGLFSSRLIQTFAYGIVADPTRISPTIPLAAAVGALVWVLFASRTGLPVSTTHALTGALCGAGLVGLGPTGVQWGSLLSKVAVPLFLSPVVAVAVTWLVFPVLRRGLSAWRGHCLCLAPSPRLVRITTRQGSPGLAADLPLPSLPIVGRAQDCRPAPAVVTVNMDSLHWLTSGLTSLARGLNDAPKIVAVMVAVGLATGRTFSAGPLALLVGLIVVAVGMGLGSWLGGRTVTEVLAEKVTRMDHMEGFTANLSTALLVTTASWLGLPVSTTHVSSSSILGVGLRAGRPVFWNTVREMLLAWVVTLPASGLIAALVLVGLPS